MFLNIVLLAVFAVLCIATGAYGHKWLAKVTGAPSNLNSATASAAVSSLVSHGTDEAHKAIDAAAGAAKGVIAKV